VARSDQRDPRCALIEALLFVRIPIAKSLYTSPSLVANSGTPLPIAGGAGGHALPREIDFATPLIDLFATHFGNRLS
jgi:hypothetical protein